MQNFASQRGTSNHQNRTEQMMKMHHNRTRRKFGENGPAAHTACGGAGIPTISGIEGRCV